jgi:hypothetical protein
MWCLLWLSTLEGQVMTRQFNILLQGMI